MNLRVTSMIGTLLLTLLAACGGEGSQSGGASAGADDLPKGGVVTTPEGANPPFSNGLPGEASAAATEIYVHIDGIVRWQYDAITILLTMEGCIEPAFQQDQTFSAPAGCILQEKHFASSTEKLGLPGVTPGSYVLRVYFTAGTRVVAKREQVVNLGAGTLQEVRLLPDDFVYLEPPREGPKEFAFHSILLDYLGKEDNALDHYYMRISPASCAEVPFVPSHPDVATVTPCLLASSSLGRWDSGAVISFLETGRYVLRVYGIQEGLTTSRGELAFELVATEERAHLVFDFGTLAIDSAALAEAEAQRAARRVTLTLTLDDRTSPLGTDRVRAYIFNQICVATGSGILDWKDTLTDQPCVFLFMLDTLIQPVDATGSFTLTLSRPGDYQVVVIRSDGWGQEVRRIVRNVTWNPGNAVEVFDVGTPAAD